MDNCIKLFKLSLMQYVLLWITALNATTTSA